MPPPTLKSQARPRWGRGAGGVVCRRLRMEKEEGNQEEESDRTPEKLLE